MALPKKLKYLNLFNDGFNYMGVVSSLTLPKLTRKLEKYRGGGMNGAASAWRRWHKQTRARWSPFCRA